MPVQIALLSQRSKSTTTFTATSCTGHRRVARRNSAPLWRTHDRANESFSGYGSGLGWHDGDRVQRRRGSRRLRWVTPTLPATGLLLAGLILLIGFGPELSALATVGSAHPLPDQPTGQAINQGIG